MTPSYRDWARIDKMVLSLYPDATFREMELGRKLFGMDMTKKQAIQRLLGLETLSTVLTAINSDETREALMLGIEAIRAGCAHRNRTQFKPPPPVTATSSSCDDCGADLGWEPIAKPAQFDERGAMLPHETDHDLRMKIVRLEMERDLWKGMYFDQTNELTHLKLSNPRR